MELTATSERLKHFWRSTPSFAIEKSRSDNRSNCSRRSNDECSNKERGGRTGGALADFGNSNVRGEERGKTQTGVYFSLHLHSGFGRRMQRIRLAAVILLQSEEGHSTREIAISRRASALKQLTYPTETVLSSKITRNRIAPSYKDSLRKSLRRRPVACRPPSRYLLPARVQSGWSLALSL